jgi:hypothetical protein
MRKKGGGRKKKTIEYPNLKDDLNTLLEASIRGDPESKLLWTSKSAPKILEELKKKGYKIGLRTISKLLDVMGYSLQANKKTKEGNSHPDRDKQFENINAKIKEFQAAGQPVISVDTKKKELIGNYKNVGKEYSKKGSPIEVNGHDFPDKELGKAVPYGVYDLAQNEGWVNVGINNDTAEFAAASIRRWWEVMGKKQYPNAKKILVAADSGGSNGYRIRLWKVELHKFAKEMGLEISVVHFPPGTSKWNKIEHRMFSFISLNWRARPLTSIKLVINLIEATTTETGLKIRCEEDSKVYQKGIKISDEELEKVNIVKDDFHGEWNYTILPSEKFL